MSGNPSAGTGWLPAVESSLPTAGESGLLVSYSMPAPDLSLPNFLNQAEGQARFFWQKGGENALYAGFGTAVQLMAWGEARFTEISLRASHLFKDARILGRYEAPILPRFFGGFSFQDDFAPDNAWAAFYPAHFVLPHYQLVQNGESSWLTINALVPKTESFSDIEAQLREALNTRYQYLLGTEHSGVDSGQIPEFELRYPMPYETWADLIQDAVAEMAAATLKKVVLARVCEIKAKTRIDVCQAIGYLNQNFAGCTRFLFEPRPYHAFYGATPEILVKTAGTQVSTMALAGSMARGETAEQDQAYANKLLHSEKERHEHQLVVDAIRRRLEPLAAELDVPDVPDVYQLRYIQHLLTPISGRLQQRSDILSLVQLLHPTPAMGGSPREPAMDFISRKEPVPRGWYAAPVGWLDSEMDGEFVVAIRSAVAQERRVWCYAGAGVVPDSRPEVEWQETDLKFQPMLRALNAS